MHCLLWEFVSSWVSVSECLSLKKTGRLTVNVVLGWFIMVALKCKTHNNKKPQKQNRCNIPKEKEWSWGADATYKNKNVQPGSANTQIQILWSANTTYKSKRRGPEVQNANIQQQATHGVQMEHTKIKRSGPEVQNTNKQKRAVCTSGPLFFVFVCCICTSKPP